MDNHRIAQRCFSLLHVIEGNIHFAVGRTDDFTIQIKQEVKAFPLYSKAVILNAVRKGVVPNHNIRTLQVEELQDLNILHTAV
ncbi:hypothetical protein D3C75_1112040 [compost metagenome]